MLDHLLTEGQTPSLSLSTHGRHIINNVIGPIMMLSRLIEAHHQRQQLAELEDHRLADLGLSWAQVRKECTKWPWQA